LKKISLLEEGRGPQRFLNCLTIGGGECGEISTEHVKKTIEANTYLQVKKKAGERAGSIFSP